MSFTNIVLMNKDSDSAFNRFSLDGESFVIFCFENQIGIGNTLTLF